MDFEVFLVLINIVSFLVCLIFFFRQIKVKSQYLTNPRSIGITVIAIISIFLLYTLVINYIFDLEFTGAVLLLTCYVLTFCLLDILLLLWHKNIISTYRFGIKANVPAFWKQLYQLFTYLYISIRSLYFLGLFLFSFYIAAPVIGMFYFGQYTLDNVINAYRHNEEGLGVKFCRYATFVLDNKLYVESLGDEPMISISKVYFWGLLKKRVLFIRHENVRFKECTQKDIVLLRQFDFTLQIENFNDYYKLDCNNDGSDTKEYVIFK